MGSVLGARNAQMQQHRRAMLVAAQGNQLQTGTAKGANRARRVQPVTGCHACAVMMSAGPQRPLAERALAQSKSSQQRHSSWCSPWQSAMQA